MSATKGTFNPHTHKAGQSLVELALALPVLVLVVAGIFDLGRAFFASITITNAARSGARYYTLHLIDANVSQIACDTTKAEANLSGITIAYSDITLSCGTPVTCLSSLTPSAGCARGQSITVQVTHLYNDMLFQFFFPAGINMSRKIEMSIP